MSNVDHPSHYNIEGRKECIIEMLEKFGEDAVKTFCILNAYKYRYRHELKGGAEDLQKAEWYENFASKLTTQSLPDRMQNALRHKEDEVKLLIEIPNRFYAKVLDEFYTHADLIDGMKAIRDGQILPDGCEILTKEAYADLCMRASKGNCSEISTGSTAKIDVPDNNVGNIDCISRSDAIHAVSEALKRTFVEYEDIANKVIGKLPSVTPQEPRWIPCSEKKPDKGGEYLLWGKIDESEEENYCFIGDYHEFDEVFGIEISNYDPETLGFLDTEIEEYYSVVAWMPTPTPYEPQESERKK